MFQFFKDAAYYRFSDKIQGSHQQVVEAFALYFDGSKALIGKEEFQVDETLIVKVAELLRTGEKWFKTTIMKYVEFRSYLKSKHKNVIWKKIIPSTWLEEKWQQLLKAVLVYITCEGRYNRVMIYHFKLMNHFTSKIPLNLPSTYIRDLPRWPIGSKPSSPKLQAGYPIMA